MATLCFDCVQCKRGTHPKARRCLSKPGNKHLLAVLQSFVADSSSFSLNTVDKNSWLCRPCSRSLEQLQAARKRMENLETDIRKKLEAIDDECQGSSVMATTTTNRPVAVANHPVAVQSLSLHRFRSSMNGNRSQRLSDFGHFNRLSIT